MLHFSCNSFSPLLTWINNCSPSSTQYLSEEKPLPGHPLQAFSDALLVWEYCYSSSMFVCALLCLLGYSGTQSKSGTETGAPLQRIEALDVRLVGHARVNVAYTCVTGRLKPPTTLSWVLHKRVVAVLFPFLNNQQQQQQQQQCYWLKHIDLNRCISYFPSRSLYTHPHKCILM